MELFIVALFTTAKDWTQLISFNSILLNKLVIVYQSMEYGCKKE